MKRQLLMLSCLLFFPAYPAVAANVSSISNAPTKVEVHDLLAHQTKHLGKIILVHACYFDTVIEGALIYPCGEPIKNGALILEIPDSKASLAGSIYRRLNSNFAIEIEADVVGLLTRDTIGTQTGKHTLAVLRLQDVLNPKIFRKFGH